MKRVMIGIIVVTIIGLSLQVEARGRRGWIRVPEDYATIQEAVDEANPGDTIIVGPGEYSGATVEKRLKIQGKQGPIINDGPYYRTQPSWISWKIGFALTEAASCTLISGFTFECGSVTDYADEVLVFPVFNRGANSVIVMNNVICDAVQGITNWHGSCWLIEGNEIRGGQAFGGGGIGIFAGSVDGTPANHNWIVGNVIVGEPVGALDYSTPAIGLMSDSRWEGCEGGPVKMNRIVGNCCAFRSPSGVGVELTDLVGNDVVCNSIACNGVCDCGWGVMVSSASRNSVWGNSIAHSMEDGIWAGAGSPYQDYDPPLPDASQNWFMCNHVTDSGANGIFMDAGSSNNLIVCNEVKGSGIYDLKDAGTDNFWWWNDYETASGNPAGVPRPVALPFAP